MSDTIVMQGDCLEALKNIPDNSLDSLVTDPPAGISFMGKSWDDDKGGRKQWIAWMAEVMTECLRVLKPGAHGLVWAIPRTSHWTATALEDAGFEVRDVVTHLFGSGFPKSLNVQKAGAGEAWQGWGTALKPASEHWILVRKPCSEKTVAKNVVKYATGALNIDASRVEGEPTHGSGKSQSNNAATGFGDMGSKRVGVPNVVNTQGRFPANLVLSHTPFCADELCDLECAIQALDEQSGVSKSTSQARHNKPSTNLDMRGANAGHISTGHNDLGGASRFFYCAKISKSERNAGLEGMQKRQGGSMSGSANKTLKTGAGNERDCSAQNHHPTVKPKKLMSYLIRMITPPNGIVLDPFMGSGSTGVAAVASGFKFIGIEREAEYVAIAEKRIAHSAGNQLESIEQVEESEDEEQDIA